MTDQDFIPIPSVKAVMALDDDELERQRVIYIDKVAQAKALLFAKQTSGGKTSRSSYLLAHFQAVLEWIEKEPKRRQMRSFAKPGEPGSAKARKEEAKARSAEAKAEKAKALAAVQQAAIEAKTQRNHELTGRLIEENRELRARVAELEAALNNAHAYAAASPSPCLSACESTHCRPSLEPSLSALLTGGH